MKTSTLARNGVSTEVADLIGRLVEAIPWPARRCAMGDVTVALLEGKQRVAEDVFGWNRRVIEVGIHEYQTGITCINDIATRVKPKTEDKYPKLLAEIHSIMEPHSESESSLRTISNLLNRQDYRLRTVASLVDGVYEKGVKIRGSEK
jgi:hypothetical protein